MAKDIKALEKKFEEIRREIEDEKDRIFKLEHAPKLRAMVGRCFVYRGNYYSCPKGPEDYWDEYYKILRVIEDEFSISFECANCRIDSNGNAMACTTIEFPFDGKFPQNHREWCNESEYRDMMDRVLKMLEADHA